MLRKLLSYKHWKSVMSKVLRLLASPHIPLWEKLTLAVPALLYIVLPDVMPLVPLDDIAVTMLLMNWFAGRMERKYKLPLEVR